MCRAAVDKLRARDIRAGLFRPITASPFPYEALGRRAKSAKAVLTVEMSMGQLVDDVKIAVAGAAPVHLFATAGGVIPKAADISDWAAGIVGEEVR